MMEAPGTCPICGKEDASCVGASGGHVNHIVDYPQEETKMAGKMVVVDRGDGHIFQMNEAEANKFINRNPGASITGNAEMAEPMHQSVGREEGDTVIQHNKTAPQPVLSSESMKQSSSSQSRSTKSDSEEGESSNSEDKSSQRQVRRADSKSE